MGINQFADMTPEELSQRYKLNAPKINHRLGSKKDLFPDVV